MTITRIFQAGFEAGDLSEFDVPNTNSGSWQNFVQTTYKTHGAYGLQTTGTGSQGSFSYKFIPATRQVRCGWYFNKLGNYDTTERICFFISNSSGTQLVSVRYAESYNIRLYVAGSLQDTAIGAITSNWFHIGVNIKIHSSAGWATIYKDGIEIASFAGNTGNTDIYNLAWGKDLGTTSAFDDIYADDTTNEVSTAPVPIYGFEPIAIAGNGSYSQWTGSDGDQIDNYQHIDEMPADDDLTYVAVTSADQLDSYNLSPLTLNTGQQIFSLISVAKARKLGAGQQLAIGTRLSSTDLIGSNQNIGVGYKALFERQTTKPGGGSWDASDIDNTDIVIESRGTF